MKNIFFIVLLCFYSISNAQIGSKNKPEKIIPQTVEAAFNLKFNNGDVVWFSRFQGRYDNQQVYEGRFMFDNRYSIAVYTPDGELIAFLATVEYLEIPIKARDYLKKQYPNQKIIDAAFVTRGVNDLTYEIGIYIDDQYSIQVFSNKGEFVKSTRG